MGLRGGAGTVTMDCGSAGTYTTEVKEWSMTDVQASPPKPKRKELLARIDRLEQANAALEAQLEAEQARYVDALAQTNYEREAYQRLTEALGHSVGWHGLSPRERDALRINASRTARRSPKFETRKGD